MASAVAGVAAMGALCGAMVPFANMAAVGLLAHHGQGRLWRELSRNPPIIAGCALVLGLFRPARA
mgnify:CR=1 FL=1